MKETIESLENLRDLLREEMAKCKNENIDMAKAYNNAVILVGEEIVNVLNKSKKLA